MRSPQIHSFQSSSNTLAVPPASDETVLIALDSDLNPDGNFGFQRLEITASQLRVLDAEHRALYSFALDSLKSARHQPLLSGGRLELTLQSGATLPVLSYSLHLAPRFSEAARGLEQLIEGKPLSINLETKRTRCEKCGRLLPEPDGICPACINRNQTLLRVASYLGPYKKQAIALALTSIMATLLNLAPPTIQGVLIDRVLRSQKDLPMLWLLVGAWVGVLACAIGLQILSARLTTWLASHIATDLRAHVYRAVEHLQLGFFDRKQVGQITSRITQDTDRVWGFLSEGLPFLVTNFLLVVGVLALLFSLNWKLALAVMSPIPLVVFVGAFFWKRMATLFGRVSSRWGRFHTHLNESLTGIRVVKAFAQEDLENQKFNHHNQQLKEAGMVADNYWSTIFGLMSFCTSLGAIINWAVGGYFVYRGELSLGDFWRANAYLGLVYGPMQWFAQVNNWFSRAMAGAEKIFEVIDSKAENYAHGGQTPPITGHVRFDNVRFGYDKSNPVLKNLSFEAKPGDFIGLVGKSGAGKSTTINLICRFYEPDAGTLLIDDHDYRDLDLQHWRRNIGIVLQEPFLFNGTVADNIAYGKPDASFEQIVAAARAAHAHEFILAKSDGYDTIVGERGAKLSGGERQRVSIARAILHDPKILILDEATASVDVETEKQIQAAMKYLTAGRTVFAIAHRLATLRNATRLVVLDKGEIVETGTHAELMEKNGEFAKLVKTQSEINEIIGVTE
ncbi:putative ABC transporter ATP-binding protein [Abditibacteriota bacterium]|nr:putative ABC transporter ATP-binding protein [Abditibacteriota bacterium]